MNFFIKNLLMLAPYSRSRFSSLSINAKNVAKTFALPEATFGLRVQYNLSLSERVKPFLKGAQ